MSSTDLWAMGGNGGMIQFNSLNASTPSMGSEFAHVKAVWGSCQALREQ